jgi:hypothetical protein
LWFDSPCVISASHATLRDRSRVVYGRSPKRSQWQAELTIHVALLSTTWTSHSHAIPHHAPSHHAIAICATKHAVITSGRSSKRMNRSFSRSRVSVRQIGGCLPNTRSTSSTKKRTWRPNPDSAKSTHTIGLREPHNQPACAYQKPLVGVCGSPAVSDSVWCARCAPTHCIGAPLYCAQSRVTV